MGNLLLLSRTPTLVTNTEKIKVGPDGCFGFFGTFINDKSQLYLRMESIPCQISFIAAFGLAKQKNQDSGLQ